MDDIFVAMKTKKLFIIKFLTFLDLSWLQNLGNREAWSLLNFAKLKAYVRTSVLS